MQLSTLFRQKSNRAKSAKEIERMVSLEGTDEDSRVGKHVLDEVRINTLMSNHLITQKRRRAIMPFRPLVKLASPTPWDLAAAGGR